MNGKIISLREQAPIFGNSSLWVAICNSFINFSSKELPLTGAKEREVSDTWHAPLAINVVKWRPVKLPDPLSRVGVFERKERFRKGEDVSLLNDP